MPAVCAEGYHDADLGPGESLEFTVSTSKSYAEVVTLLVDDGNDGGPAPYTLARAVTTRGTHEWMTYEVTGTEEDPCTERMHRDDSLPTAMRYTLTHVGEEESAHYRVYVKSHS
ncbi:hypothetical protein [Halopelagius fulvigenes]|uniref:Uncharacterized protein n=1 Tax=Halopelagius fulvigenes TaxID=1198324 RepID=A0ABD5TXH1_9EURY